jgi:hypothetical protein
MNCVCYVAVFRRRSNFISYDDDDDDDDEDENVLRGVS